MNRLLSILFWSIIAAAFIGPGTITTCASAGTGYGTALLWALVFSTFGCFVLQEAAARLAVATGSSLALTLGQRSRGSRWGVPTLLLVLGAIVLGCAAYQAGNVVGAVAGASLGTPLSRATLTWIICAVALVLLAGGTTRTVARVMGLVVAVMGTAFLITALRLGPAPAELLRGALVPTLPGGAGLLVVGLIGTTIVPYNLFLGSGLVGRQTLSEVRWGLGVAIVAGGIISMAVVVVGGAIEGSFSFAALSETLAGRIGPWAGALFALGLFCAGFSSAVTAPLAAAITARGLFDDGSDSRWGERGWRYRGVWLSVLLTGLLFGLSDLRPVPVILVAQALNGLLLPIVAAFLLVLVNDRALMGERINGVTANAAMALTFGITVLLGVSNLLRAGARALGLRAPDESLLFVLAATITLALSLPLTTTARRRRMARPD